MSACQGTKTGRGDDLGTNLEDEMPTRGCQKTEKTKVEGKEPQDREKESRTRAQSGRIKGKYKDLDNSSG